jgi:tRNA (cytidine/uridine-2'-O-)-methyltransferase
MRLALYQPDIPQNTGTILRMAACLGVAVDIIDPAGFDLSDRALRRAGLDYLAHVEMTRHASWEAFLDGRARLGGRIVLLTAKADLAHVDLAWRTDDILLLGRESTGVPDAVHGAAEAKVRVPMQAGMRSLNIAVAAAIVLGEAMRQTALFQGRTPQV